MKIAFITGGGDSAGINAALARSIIHGIDRYNDTFIGIERAFEGLASENIQRHVVEMGGSHALKIFDTPSTVLGSSRFAPFSEENRSWAPDRIRENCREQGIEAIITTGGNDTVNSALGLHRMGLPVIAIPKSIDNDISGTDWMLGANTAVDFAVQAFRSTAVSAETHARININEIMGRKAGWLAYMVGIGCGADLILVPEKDFSFSDLAAEVRRLYTRKGYVSIVVSEGITLRADDPAVKKSLHPAAKDKTLLALLSEKRERDPHGNLKLGGAGIILQRLLAQELGCSLSTVRNSNIGFALRGLQPNAFDINLGQRFGRKAIELLHQGRSGMMTGIRGTAITAVPLEEALPQNNLDSLDEQELRDFGVFFTARAEPVRNAS